MLWWLMMLMKGLVQKLGGTRRVESTVELPWATQIGEVASSPRRLFLPVDASKPYRHALAVAPNREHLDPDLSAWPGRTAESTPHGSGVAHDTR